jgi:tetratricopeptide (TPR) repeat protein
VKSVLILILLAADLSTVWQRATRGTSSEASNRRGVKQFVDKQYTDAAKSFARSNEIAPGPAAAFNLGTAQVAAGKREEGSATLTSAMEDPQLRAGALFNRGNSALASHAYDHAVRDYIEVLKLRPADPAAKRNLEIALRRKEAMQRSQQGQADPKGQQQQPPQSPQQQPSSDGKDERSTDRDAGEALLRSAQQQEQEELSRMRRSRPEQRRVGW